mgnify:CR=1 FL=1|tara:strand:+ start:289 stop:1158 length:870 start_codon:yes stop_codon:yes gene_type:complete
MYNYIYGTKKQILNAPEDFLIFVKRLLPKYANSLPDSAIPTFYEQIKKLKGNSNSLVETGVGASTIILFFLAYKFKKKLYSFDYNPDKISLVRGVINEAICLPLNININDYWVPIPSNSTDKYTGINCLSEFKDKFDFGFFDSAHSLNILIGEISAFQKIATKNFILGIDDGNHFNNKYFHFDFVNMIRTKLNLKKIKNPTDNKCDYFYKEIYSHLKDTSKHVKRLPTFFEKNFENDLYFNFFGNDISYQAVDDKKDFKNFKLENVFKNISKKEKEIYKNRICFYSVGK